MLLLSRFLLPVEQLPTTGLQGSQKPPLQALRPCATACQQTQCSWLILNYVRLYITVIFQTMQITVV